MTYASQIAITRARAVGLDLRDANWREIFLAITDEIASDPPSAPDVSAGFVGKVRDGAERWRIIFRGRQFDVIYDPAISRIILVIRSQDPDTHTAVLPKPTPPLKGNAAARILESA